MSVDCERDWKNSNAKDPAVSRMEPAIFGPVDTVLEPVIEYVILVLVLINLGTRFRAHRSHVTQAANGGPEAVSRHLGHEASNFVLVFTSFYYLTLHHHAGFVLSTLVIGMIITDFFEFESREVEARNDMEFEQPKAALGVSALVLIYAAYYGLQFLYEPYLDLIFA